GTIAPAGRRGGGRRVRLAAAAGKAGRALRGGGARSTGLRAWPGRHLLRGARLAGPGSTGRTAGGPRRLAARRLQRRGAVGATVRGGAGGGCATGGADGGGGGPSRRLAHRLSHPARRGGAPQGQGPAAPDANVPTLTQNAPAQRTGGLRFGKYVLLDRLAVGGMAEIFLARQEGMEGFEKTVVIKRIRPHLSKQKSFVTMFLDEARLAA